MTTTATTPNRYAPLAATKPLDELHQAIAAQESIVKHGDVSLFSDNEITQGHAIYQAAMDEIHTRALAEYTDGGSESPKARRDRTHQTAGQCTIATLNADTEDQADGYTRRVALDELHRRALQINADRTTWLAGTGERILGLAVEQYDQNVAHGDPGLLPPVSKQAMLTELRQRAEIDREHQAHLVSRKAAVRYLAGLIRDHGMDGEDVADMGHDQFDGMTRADRSAYPVPYTFLLSACAKFEVDGYDLLHDAVTVLGW